MDTRIEATTATVIAATATDTEAATAMVAGDMLVHAEQSAAVVLVVLPAVAADDARLWQPN
jgi:hypothetical protein